MSKMTAPSAIDLLVVDDDAEFRETLVSRFVRAGFAVQSAGNGEEALAFTEEHHPDLVLLDISMPGENGLAVLPKLKRLMPPPKVVILSIHASERVAKQALALGADDYITKESAVEELINSIRKIFPA